MKILKLKYLTRQKITLVIFILGGKDSIAKGASLQIEKMELSAGAELCSRVGAMNFEFFFKYIYNYFNVFKF